MGDHEMLHVLHILVSSLFVIMQLQGLTTGGLPTFVDIGHSFGAPAIVEDNLISQVVSALSIPTIYWISATFLVAI